MSMTRKTKPSNPCQSNPKPGKPSLATASGRRERGAASPKAKRPANGESASEPFKGGSAEKSLAASTGKPSSESLPGKGSEAAASLPRFPAGGTRIFRRVRMPDDLLDGLHRAAERLNVRPSHLLELAVAENLDFHELRTDAMRAHVANRAEVSA